jgi:phosphonate degradation associated HDIG domain protein
MGLRGEIGRTFAEHGAALYGERVTQLEHALQCAALAEAEGATDALITAALLHDYGHLFEGRGDAAERDGVDLRHEAFGARALRRWFGPAVTRPIALHVAAKRYLCAAEPAYEAALSPASGLSLRLQGGRFTDAQRRAFERAPFARDAVRLRRWDDAGKVEGARTPIFDHYWPLLDGLARARRA